MKAFDRFLQNWRIKLAGKYINKNSKILDIGCFDGTIFKQLKNKNIYGFGIEPLLKSKIVDENFTIIPGYFPTSDLHESNFDSITMLAILEHIPTNKQNEIFNECYKLLNKNGNLIITVPSPFADKILEILTFFRIIDGMSLEEHFGFKPKDTLKLAMDSNFSLKVHKRFQLGLNNLFVFEKK